MHDFMPRHEFVIALLTHSDHVPPETTESFIPIRVSEKQSKVRLPIISHYRLACKGEAWSMGLPGRTM